MSQLTAFEEATLRVYLSDRPGGTSIPLEFRRERMISAINEVRELIRILDENANENERAD